MKIIITLIFLLLAIPAQANFTPEECLALTRSYWTVYEITGEKDNQINSRIEKNCMDDKVDEMIFSDDDIQDTIKRLQLTGVVTAS